MTFKLGFAFIGLLFVCQIWCGFAKRKGDVVHQEDPCSLQGGACAKKEYCGEIGPEGLCPKQQKNGVECCFKITGPNQTEPSNLHENCGTRGGVCMTRCADILLDPTGRCVGHLLCCVVVT